MTFLTYQKFTHQSEAEEVVALLSDAEIPFELEGTKPPFDPTFAFTSYEPEVELKIKPGDFERTEILLNKHYQKMTESVPSDYYLFNFSDEELRGVVSTKDEWGHFDYVLAKKLLAERGAAISTEHENEIASRRLDELRKPSRLGVYWIVAGYVLAVVGSLIGFFMALTIKVFRKTLPNGKLVPAYDNYSRNHATVMIFISSILLALRFNFQIPLFYELIIPFF